MNMCLLSRYMFIPPYQPANGCYNIPLQFHYHSLRKVIYQHILDYLMRMLAGFFYSLLKATSPGCTPIADTLAVIHCMMNVSPVKAN